MQASTAPTSAKGPAHSPATATDFGMGSTGSSAPSSPLHDPSATAQDSNAAGCFNFGGMLSLAASLQGSAQSHMQDFICYPMGHNAYWNLHGLICLLLTCSAKTSARAPYPVHDVGHLFSVLTTVNPQNRQHTSKQRLLSYLWCIPSMLKSGTANIVWHL